MQRAMLAALFLTVACSGNDATSTPTSSAGGGGGGLAENGGASGVGASAGAVETGGAVGNAGSSGAGDAAGAAGELSGCEVNRAALEQKMASELDAAAVDPKITSVPDFTLALEADDGHRFVHAHGNSSLDTVYESASTSKWVSAAIILSLVDRGVLALGDEPSKYLDFWQTKGVTLAQLLAFTSGYSKEPLCINLPTADFADCVQKGYAANPTPPAPGSEFDYSSTHLQIAGLMAIRAAKAQSWQELYVAWQKKTQLFPTATYDLPSVNNPRLAGGMHWKGSEYLKFLRAVYDGKWLNAATRSAMLANQRGSATVGNSPSIDAVNQDWAYGYGNWLECRTAIGPNTFDCGAGHRNSSPGAYGAYPFIDFDHHYIGILARQGGLGTFREGDALFQVVAADAAAWADACPGP